MNAALPSVSASNRMAPVPGAPWPARPVSWPELPDPASRPDGASWMPGAALRPLLEAVYSQLLASNAAGAMRLVERALGSEFGAAGHGLQEDLEIDRGARVVVRTLGGFALSVDGAALPFGKKPARRTLALLKAIVAFGGRDVCRTLVADALWPDLEGDRAQNALEVTLHRLRARLRVPGAVLSQQGRLALNADLVWVDAFAFDAASRAVNPAAGCAPIERAFALYQGAFLPEEDASAWAARMRERLRTRFVSIVAGAAAALEARERLEEAIKLYERGIAADEMVAAFHDGLVRCLARMGRMGEAQAQSRRRRALDADALR